MKEINRKPGQGPTEAIGEVFNLHHQNITCWNKLNAVWGGLNRSGLKEAGEAVRGSLKNVSDLGVWPLLPFLLESWITISFPHCWYPA